MSKKWTRSIKHEKSKKIILYLYKNKISIEKEKAKHEIIRKKNKYVVYNNGK